MALLERNHYRVLCVAPDASVEELERSFRQLARRLHPDLNGGDGAAEERMKELNVARTMLTEPGSRAAYDERLRREQRAKGPPLVPPSAAPAAPPPVAAAPQSAWAPASSSPGAPRFHARPLGAGPLLSWMKTRDVPRAPAATPEISRMASVSRLFWFGLAALLGLAVVVSLILLRQALDS
jgi:curved DNA-binding protein CbpA